MFFSFRLCLSLITDKAADVQVELDLVDSLYLLQDLNVSMLPLQGIRTFSLCL